MPSSHSIFGFGRAARAASASSALASAAAAEAANEDTHALTRVETSSHTTCITETEGQRAARAASAMEVDAPPTLGPPVALAGLAEAEMRDAAAVASSAARKASESARRDLRVQLEALRPLDSSQMQALARLAFLQDELEGAASVAAALGLAAPAPRPQLSAPCRRALRDAFAVRDSLLKVRNASSCLADIEWTSRAPCGAGGAPNAHASLKDSAAHALP